MTFACFLFISAEKLVEDLNTAVLKMPSESASEDLAPKVVIYFVALPLLKKKKKHLESMLNVIERQESSLVETTDFFKSRCCGVDTTSALCILC